MTREDIKGVRDMIISIHTPAKGVTECRCDCGTNVTNFNPHSREGSDTAYKGTAQEHFISINTPAKGVTTAQRRISRGYGNFNPHSREGSDDYSSVVADRKRLISIHTPAKGVTCKCHI